MRTLSCILLALAFLLPAAVHARGDPGRVVVGLADAADLPQVGDSVFGGIVVARVPQIGAVALDAPSVAASLALARGSPGVRYAEPDHPVWATTAPAPNDPRWSTQWGPERIGVRDAWDVTRGSHAVTIAVLDSGVQRNHEDLRDANILLGASFMVGTTTDVADGCGHGTAVVGVIAATTDNARGIAGIANVTILPVKVLDAVPNPQGQYVIDPRDPVIEPQMQCRGLASGLAQGLVYAADSGADIISMSLGSIGDSAVVREAVTYAHGKGALLVAASGNDYCLAASGCVHYPGAYPEVIAVGATASNDTRADFSNGDATLDLAGPGHAIATTARNDWYASPSGTSFATPHVSAVASLMLSAKPTATAAQLRTWLESTAIDLGAAGHDASFGHGLVNASAAVALAAAS